MNPRERVFGVTRCACLMSAAAACGASAMVIFTADGHGMRAARDRCGHYAQVTVTRKLMKNRLVSCSRTYIQTLFFKFLLCLVLN